MIKKISINWEGPELLMDAAIDALAKEAGWCEGAIRSKEELASDLINQFVRQKILEYSVEQAEAQTLAAVEVNKKIAAEQSMAALEACTKSIGIEDV